MEICYLVFDKDKEVEFVFAMYETDPKIVFDHFKRMVFSMVAGRIPLDNFDALDFDVGTFTLHEKVEGQIPDQRLEDEEGSFEYGYWRVIRGENYGYKSKR